MPKKNLENLIAGIEVVGSLGDRNREIEHIAFDSRKVRQGSLFVAISGKKHDGKTFLNEAVDKGAIAVIVQSSPKSVSSLIAKKITLLLYVWKILEKPCQKSVRIITVNHLKI